jgi:hypothetical protein
VYIFLSILFQFKSDDFGDDDDDDAASTAREKNVFFISVVIDSVLVELLFLSDVWSYLFLAATLFLT